MYIKPSPCLLNGPQALPQDPLDLELVKDVGDGLLLDQVNAIHHAVEHYHAALVSTLAHSATASLSCSPFCFQSCSATFHKVKLGSSLANQLLRPNEWAKA